MQTNQHQCRGDPHDRLLLELVAGMRGDHTADNTGYPYDHQEHGRAGQAPGFPRRFRLG